MKEKHQQVNRAALAALVAEALTAPTPELLAIRVGDERVEALDLTPREALDWCKRAAIPVTRLRRGLYVVNREQVLAAVSSGAKTLPRRVRKEALARAAAKSCELAATEVLVANGLRVAG